MAWNIFMHVLIGLLGTELFTLTVNGVLLAIIVVIATQGSDLLRVYRARKRKIEEGPAKERVARMKELKETLPSFLGMTFAKGLFYYTLLVLISSEIARAGGQVF